MAANPDVVDTTKPEAIVPDTATTPVTEPLINVDVADRLLRELRRRLFPNEIESIIVSAQVGDLFWKDQLWSLMVNNWPRLQTNLGKLKRAVSSMEYVVNAYVKRGDQPTSTAVDKANFVEDALLGMHGDIAFQEHDFKETLEDIVDTIISGFNVMEIYWEVRDGLGTVPQCTRWLPSRYYRYPYVITDRDRLMLNPSGMLGGTQLVDFPPYKFLRCIYQSHAHHPVFSSPMDCLTSWWLASRFGLEWFMTYAQLFGIPRRTAYYQPGDDVVYQKLVQMMRTSAAATWGVFPVGTQVTTETASGATGHLPQERLIEEADRVCDILILGQTLTTEVHESGSRALGQVHRTVMDEVFESAAKYAAKLITSQIIPGIVQYNYGNLDELPTLEPVVKSPKDLLQMAQAFNIFFNQMRIPIDKQWLYDQIECPVPEEDSELYDPPAAPAPIAPFLGGKPQIEGAPEEEGVAAPGHAGPSSRSIEPTNGEKAGGEPARAAIDDPDNDIDPDDGEELIEIEARHEHRHPKTGRFVPAPRAPKRKVGVKPKEPMPEVGLMCKRNEDMGDAKVCQACKEISAEGWIPVDEEFLGYSMNPPHHPNCRCDVDYKTRYRGADIYHQTKSGNPHHHPETGRFVSKPGNRKR
jgi:phage gp29-like protein